LGFHIEQENVLVPNLGYRSFLPFKAQIASWQQMEGSILLELQVSLLL
jgi:hypothetical protein